MVAPGSRASPATARKARPSGSAASSSWSTPAASTCRATSRWARRCVARPARPSRRPRSRSSWWTARSGVAPQDHEIAAHPAPQRVPVVLAVNKHDAQRARRNLHEYWQLGLGEPIGISAEHGLGVGDLLDEVVAAPARGPVTVETPSSPSGWPSSAVPTWARARCSTPFWADQRTIVSSDPGHHPGRHRHRPGVRRHADDPDRHGRPAAAAASGRPPTWSTTALCALCRALERSRRGSGGGRRQRGPRRPRPAGRLRGPAGQVRHGRPLQQVGHQPRLDLDMATRAAQGQGPDEAAAG